jgi:glycerophosphoryl diester phosphodiesterase
MAAADQHRPWLERRVLTYAHQGGAFEAPSSTLYAIRRALELGVTGIELDVHATADRELVVCHDRTVDRTTSGSGLICELTWPELRQLDNAYWFVPGTDADHDQPQGNYPLRGRAPTDPELGIARLADVLDLLDDHPGVALNLDIKATAPIVQPYERLLADLLRGHRCRERTIVASFWDAATDAFRQWDSETSTSAGTQAVASFWQAVQHGNPPTHVDYVALQVPERSGDLVVVDATFVDAAHRAGAAVHVWTVNDPTSMERLLDLGVDGIISDRPSVLVEMVDRRGQRYQPPPAQVGPSAGG